MRAETGPIGGDLSHEFIVLAETGEVRRLLRPATCSTCRCPARMSTMTADLTPIIQQWTSVYAATEDVHDAARFEREVPEEKRVHTRGIEVGQIFYFGTKYSEPMKALVRGRRRSRGRDSRWLLRRRRFTAGRRHHRSLPRRGRHQMAGGGRAVQGGDPELEAGFGRYGWRLRSALPRVDRQRRRSALRRYRPARGCEVCRGRSGRHSLADPRRPKRPCRGQVRAQASKRRYARESRVRPKCWRGWLRFI